VTELVIWHFPFFFQKFSFCQESLAETISWLTTTDWHALHVVLQC